MNRTSRLILKIHAAFLMILTVSLTIAGFVGLNTGMGPYSWLRDFPTALVGLMQAYLLMLLIGVSVWIGANGERIWRWSVIAIAAHCIPLLAIFSLWNVLADAGLLGITMYSYVIHGAWILIETISLGLMARQRGASNAAAFSQHS
ncbi:MAG: hypothetical protein MI924_27655 [Chloroflexales bacterium]|nr:hypothetical protein [Chloroflexales bacterium]